MTSSDTKEHAEVTSAKDARSPPPLDSSRAAAPERESETFSSDTDDEDESGRSLAFVYVMLAFLIGVIGIAWAIYAILS
jgi:hypothetical protein